MPQECLIKFLKLNPRERIAGILQRGVDQGVFRGDADLTISAALIENFVYAPTYHSLRETLEHKQITRGIIDHHLRALRP